MNILQNEPLCQHTTLRVGGPAHFFLEAKTEVEITEGVKLAESQRLPLFVLGGGSNVLIGDQGFPGLVIKIATRGIQLHPMPTDEPDSQFELVAEAGEEWDALVAFAVERGFIGLENMSLIPGSVGAAVVGNIGAYGAEVKDVLLWAEVLDLHSHSVRRLSAKECDLAYRWSFFKTAAGRNFIVLRAAFGLARNGSLNMGYKDVQAYFASRSITAPALKDVREAVLAIRRGKLPDVAQIGTAGSFFKNPVISKAAYADLAVRFPGLPGFEAGNGLMKIPLGWILDKVCRLRGVRKGRVGTHADQALVIVNEGGTAAEIEAFAQYMANTVKDMTGLTVEWEVEKV